MYGQKRRCFLTEIRTDRKKITPGRANGTDVSQTILIVDDDIGALDLYTRICHTKGFKVSVSMDGSDALQKAVAEKPDLILLDVFLPGMDGMDVCRNLRSDHVTQDIPIIIITGDTERRTRIDALESGANDYLVKPVDDAELLARINNLLKIRQYEEMKMRNEVLLQTMHAVENAKKEWEQIFDSISDIVLLIDDNGCVVRCNRPFVVLIGKPYQELIGENWQKLLSERGASSYLEKSGDTVYFCDNSYLKVNYHEIEKTGTSEKNIFLVTLQNISGMKKASAAIQESEERLRKLLDASPHAIFVYREDRFQYHNEAFERITGYAREELVNMKVWDIVHESCRDTVKARIIARQKGEEAPERYELPVLTRSGEMKWADIAITTLVLHDVPSILVFASDVTEMKRNRQEIDRLASFPQMSPLPIIEAAVDGETLYINPAAQMFFRDAGIENEWRHATGSVRDIAKALDQSETDQIVRDVSVSDRWYTQVVLAVPGTGTVRIYHIDITDRKKSELELNRLKVAFDQAMDGIAISDMGGTLIYLNKSWMAMHGYDEDPQSFVGKKISIFHTADQIADMAEFINIAVKQGSNEGVLGHLRKNGNTFVASVAVTIIRDNDGRPIGMVGSARDITEHVLMENRLKESEERFRIVAEQTGQIIYDSEIATGDMRWFGAFRTITGYEGEEHSSFNRQEWARHIHPEDRDYAVDLLGKTKETPKYFCEYRFLRKDGTYIYIEDSGIYVRDESGNPLRMLGVMKDITERKEIEKTLKDSEEKYRSIFENATEGIFRTTPEGKMIAVNPALARMMGSDTPQEHIQHYDNLEESSHYVDIGDRHRFIELLNEKGSVTGFEVRMYRKDRTIIWVTFNAHVVRNSDGKALYYEGTIVDISERKYYEEKLKESEERYRIAIEYSNDAIALIADIQRPRYLYVNNRFLKMFGYRNASEVIGRPAISIIHPDDRKVFVERGQDITIDNIQEDHYEIKGIRRDGTALYLDTSLAVTPYKGRTAVLVCLRDITERRQFEEKIVESEERYRIAIEQSHDGVSLIADGVHIYVNRPFVEMFGYSRPEEIIGRSETFIVHPDDMPLVEEYRMKREHGEPVPTRYEMKGIRRDGGVVHIEASSTNIQFRGKATILTFLRDITSRKVAEKAIRIEQEKFRALSENAPFGLTLIDSDGTFSYRNRRFREIFGYDDEEIANGRDWFRKVYPDPDYRKQVITTWVRDVESLVDTEAGSVSRNWDFRAVCKDGTEKMISFTPVRLNTGQHLLSCVDVTERYRAQEALKQERMRFEKLTENAPFGVILVGKNNRFEYVNQKFLDLFGYDLSDTPTGREWLRRAYPDPDDRRAVKDAWKEDFQSRSSESRLREYAVTCKNGTKKVTSFITVHLETGEFIMTCEDVTHRRESERELEKSHAVLMQKNAELEKAYTELKSAQLAILQSEKMASIGQLAAGVAHEINNPVGFIMSNLNSLEKYTDKIAQFVKAQSEALGSISKRPDDVRDIMQEIEEQRRSLKIDFMIEDLSDLVKESLDGANRVKGIVQDLKSFSRIDEMEWKLSDINAGLESTVNIVWNELKYKATVKKDYGTLPMTRCNMGQLNQVFMNILVNAAQAIEHKGEIVISTGEEDGSIIIRISDTGSGIPADRINRIFEPFFTTKEVGKGTGLGLSIAYDIVRKHNGIMTVESEVGKGTAFTIRIPVTEG